MSNHIRYLMLYYMHYVECALAALESPEQLIRDFEVPHVASITTANADAVIRYCIAKRIRDVDDLAHCAQMLQEHVSE